jgi:cation-transporting ATPase 13A2
MIFSIHHISSLVSMADPPSQEAGPSSIPSAIEISRSSKADQFHPIPIPAASQNISRTYHDYTENAPQAVVDAIAVERAREEMGGPPDMMVGSFQSWAGTDGGW